MFNSRAWNFAYRFYTLVGKCCCVKLSGIGLCKAWKLIKCYERIMHILASMRAPLMFSRLIPHLNKAEGISFHSAEFQDSGCSRRSDSMYTPSPRSDGSVANPLGKWKPLPSSRSLRTLRLIWLGLCRRCLPRIRVRFCIQQVQDLVNQVVPMSLGLISTWRRDNPWVFRAGLSITEARVCCYVGRNFGGICSFSRTRNQVFGRSEPRELARETIENWLTAISAMVQDRRRSSCKDQKSNELQKYGVGALHEEIRHCHVHCAQKKLTSPILGREFCWLSIRPMNNTPALLNMSNTETSMECCTCLRYYVHEHVSTLSCYNL